MRVVEGGLYKFLVFGALVFCQVWLSASGGDWWRGEKRVPSPETGCRAGRKLAGLGDAGAEGDIICFCSAGRQGEKAVISC